MKPLISIVMPNYNKEPWIADAIESVLAQKYKNWELIIYDDGSKDGSLDVIEHYKKLDKRIKLIASKKNQGIAVARNEATKEAKGTIIVVHDSDDLMFPLKLKRIYEYFKKGCDVFYSNYIHCDIKGIPARWEQFNGISPYDLLFPKQKMGHLTVAYKKKCWEKHPYKGKYKINDDYPFLIGLYNAGYKFVHCPEFLCMMRLLSTGASYQNKKQTSREMTSLAKTIKKRK